MSRVVDAHVHILPDRVRADRAATADPWFQACHASRRAVLAGPRDLLEAMDADGVDRAWCFTWPFASPALCAEANDWLANAVAAQPDRLIGFGAVNPADPGAAAEAVRCARMGLRGIGELNADAQGWSLDDLAGFAPLAAACSEAALPVNLHASEPVGHAYAGKGTAGPQRVERLALAFGDLRIVAAHLGGGLPLYAHMREVRALFGANLWVDTAAVPFLYDAGVYGHAVALAGAGRVLLGSDFPLLRPSRYLADIGAQLSPAAAAAVCGGAADALLP
ncbi:MAG TPA: amidohydrolase family protein [Candidatus Dormibacteraeota bacterium]|nr:amidohydrolase family protein [Candidatus Dormibacteraeota bacterium]